MNCLEFKRLALSDPSSKDDSFIKHSHECPDCSKYVASLQQMDSDLSSSLDISVPDDLVARLKLNQLIEEEEAVVSRPRVKFAVAASFAVAIFVAGFMVSNQFGVNNSIGDDYEALLSGVVEHMHKQSITPVWDTDRANRTANTLLASYDGEMKLKYLENLQFSRICPMGQYRGLHATLETPDGQVTFAYFKGDSVGELLDAGYGGYVTRIKPVRGGNLVIMTKKSLEQANDELEEAMYWEI